MERRGKRYLLAGAVSAIAVLSCAAPAGAELQNGIDYTNVESPLPGGSPQGGAVLQCLTDGFPLSTGVVHEGGSDVLLTRIFFAHSSGTDDLLDSGAFNYLSTATVDKDANKTVICDETSPKYVEAKAPAPDHKRTKATAWCGAKRHVYGGGVNPTAFLELYLASSYPVDGPDKDKKPDDGWRGSIDNTDSDDTPKIRVIAVCGKEKPSYVSASDEIPDTGLIEVNVTCPEATPNVLGGGAKLPKSYNNARVSSSYNYKATPLFDSWDVAAYNFAPGGASMTTHAVCIGDQLE